MDKRAGGSSSKADNIDEILNLCNEFQEGIQNKHNLLLALLLIYKYHVFKTKKLNQCDEEIYTMFFCFSDHSLTAVACRVLVGV